MEIPSDMTGRSLVPVLKSGEEGRVDAQRDHVLTGRERHTQCQPKPNPGGYPMRAIRTDKFLYIRNFCPDRWPAGCPDSEQAFNGREYGDCDNSPTKKLLVERRNDTAFQPYFALAFDRRPGEELYDLEQDPHQLTNVADDPRYATAKAELVRQLMAELAATGDPRATGGGEEFDRYPYRH